jgi:hypothetical protein
VSAVCPTQRLAAGIVLGASMLGGGMALLIWGLGVSQQARRLLGLTFTDPAREPEAALEIAATNLRLVAACLVAAWAVGRRPPLRLAFDVTLGLLSAANAAAVGVALGGYGVRLLEAVALHGPLELAAFALAGGAYLAARARELPIAALAVTAGIASSLVAAGALIETYVPLGGDE